MNIIQPYIFKNKTVSVVCNGSSLIKNNYAQEIDNSDLVIRINTGVLHTDSYKEYIGSRLDIYATNGYNSAGYTEILNFIKLLPPETIILSTRPLKDYNLGNALYACKPFIDLFNKINNKIIEIPPDIFTTQSYNYNNFSSGIAILLFLLKNNTKLIKLFGMDSLQGGYFYNEDAKFGDHSSNKEFEILQDIKHKNANVIHYV